MNAWGMTDKGKVRPTNQDAFIADVINEDKCAVIAVCDGMGGAKSGNVASHIAISTFAEEIKNQCKPLMSEQYIKNIMQLAIETANRQVFETAQTSSEYTGMGTTFVGAIVTQKHFVIANVGDSRAYLISPENGIVRITRDHSLVEEMVQRGEITKEQAVKHPSRNLITRALGAEESIQIDIFAGKPTEGSFILLCSDGLSNFVMEQEILFEVLHAETKEDCCRQLINIANERGGTDNITAVLLAV